MTRRTPPTQAELVATLRDRRNWGRWGVDDQRGAVNLVDEAKRAAAARLVRTGQAVSLSRRLRRVRGGHGQDPVELVLETEPWADRGAGYAHERLTVDCHDRDITHLDALCHIWDADGMWGGRRPEDVLTREGSSWGDVDQWSEGIVTRGVLLDVPALRGVDYVAVDEPVHGAELEEAARAQGIALEPGDAVCVFGGREAWERRERDSWPSYPPMPRPGLHASCVEFLRDHDVAVLVWDLIDARPTEYDAVLDWPVHGALIAFGVALVDHAELEPLVEACRALGRYEFMLVVAPLRVPGATGSPVNPIALL